ncbi:MAG: sugar transferase [Paludibacteraceae bacterium]|nr:sugar transferase [Paludibacteraceae bacterium]
MINKRNYKNPKISYLFTDLLLLSLTFYIILRFFPLVAKNPFQKYSIPFLVFVPIWFLSGVSFRKYTSYRVKNLKSVLKSIFKADALAIALSIVAIFFFPALDLSSNVLLSIAVGLFVLEVISALIYFSYRYAVEIENEEIRPVISQQQNVLKEDKLLDTKTQAKINELIVNEIGENAYKSLLKKVRIGWRNTFVLSTTSSFNVLNLKVNQYSTIVNLKKINDIRGINEFFIAVHDRLPYQGVFVGCFRCKSSYKRDFLGRYPIGLNYILYSINYIIKRILPKLGITREIYFWFTGGKKRILTKAEVLGRLYCCGFEVIEEFKVDRLNYFIVRKEKEPNRNEVKTYGPIIKLNRIGQNGKLFEVYKFRTMHPFSEYLQPYIFEKNNLQEGGKIKRDIRIASVGRFMRKYWLDELPMLWNLVKGDMKLVGVRPISKHYYSLYRKELQQKRILFKPGLLPPFYADMPNTLDEIQNSELRYLDSCSQNGVFKTDMVYLWKIIFNILVKKARSN